MDKAGHAEAFWDRKSCVTSPVEASATIKTRQIIPKYCSKHPLQAAFIAKIF